MYHFQETIEPCSSYFTGADESDVPHRHDRRSSAEPSAPRVRFRRRLLQFRLQRVQNVGGQQARGGNEIHVTKLDY